MKNYSDGLTDSLTAQRGEEAVKSTMTPLPLSRNTPRPCLDISDASLTRELNVKNEVKCLWKSGQQRGFKGDFQKDWMTVSEVEKPLKVATQM